MVLAGGPRAAGGIAQIMQGMDAIPWKSGYYYSVATVVGAASSATFALVANRIYAQPLWIPRGEAIDQIGCRVNTSAAAGAVLKVGLFAMGADGRPDALIDGSGNMTADAGGEKLYTLAAPVTGGRWVHIAVWSDNTPTMLAISGTAVLPFGETSASGISRTYGHYHDVAFGAWPASFGSADGTIVTTGILLSARAV